MREVTCHEVERTIPEFNDIADSEVKFIVKIAGPSDLPDHDPIKEYEIIKLSKDQHYSFRHSVKRFQNGKNEVSKSILISKRGTEPYSYDSYELNTNFYIFNAAGELIEYGFPQHQVRLKTVVDLKNTPLAELSVDELEEVVKQQNYKKSSSLGYFNNNIPAFTVSGNTSMGPDKTVMTSITILDTEPGNALVSLLDKHFIDNPLIVIRPYCEINQITGKLIIRQFSYVKKD